MEHKYFHLITRDLCAHWTPPVSNNRNTHEGAKGITAPSDPWHTRKIYWYTLLERAYQRLEPIGARVLPGKYKSRVASLSCGFFSFPWRRCFWSCENNLWTILFFPLGLQMLVLIILLIIIIIIIIIIWQTRQNASYIWIICWFYWLHGNIKNWPILQPRLIVPESVVCWFICTYCI